MTSDEYQRLLDASFRFLSFRPRSEKEISTFLHKKNSELAANVIERLRELNYVDDTKFTQWWVSQRQGRKPKGMQLIVHELLSKGVARDTIDQVLSSDVENQLILATKALQRKTQTIRDRKKLMDFLMRRGFDATTSRRAIDESLGKR